MAKGKKTGGRDFQPGQSGNIEGARKHDPATKAIRKLTRVELAEIASDLLHKTRAEVEALATDPTTPMLKAVILGQMVNAANGNSTCFEVVLNRIVGKVKDEIEVAETTVNQGKTEEEMRAIFNDPESQRLSRALALRQSKLAAKKE